MFLNFKKENHLTNKKGKKMTLEWLTLFKKKRLQFFWLLKNILNEPILKRVGLLKANKETLISLLIKWVYNFMNE